VSKKSSSKFIEKTGIREVPELLISDLIRELHYTIRNGVDKLKMNLLLSMSLRENGLTQEDKATITDSIKRAYNFVLSNLDQMKEKASKHSRLYA
jgi:hypothetical protein